MISRIEVDDSDARQIAVAIKAASKTMVPVMEANADAISDIARELVLSEIEKIPKIGKFMAPRTKITVTNVGGVINLSVSGYSEGEVPDAPRSGGDVTPEMNLWAWHEAGPFKDSHGNQISYVKDAGGVTAVRKGASAGAGSMYKGSVKKVVSGLTKQLNELIQMAVRMAAYNIASTTIETSSRGKVKIARSSRSALKAAGVSESFLASLGVAGVTVSKTGQISVRGKGGRFMPQKVYGIPTKVRTK